jgi:ribosome maturation factor RimP
MTPEERAAAVCREMAEGPLILEEPFDRWVERQVAAAVRAAVEEEREWCARLAEVHAEVGITPVAAHAIAAAIRAKGKA